MNINSGQHYEPMEAVYTPLPGNTGSLDPSIWATPEDWTQEQALEEERSFWRDATNLTDKQLAERSLIEKVSSMKEEIAFSDEVRAIVDEVMKRTIQSYPTHRRKLRALIK